MEQNGKSVRWWTDSIPGCAVASLDRGWTPGGKTGAYHLTTLKWTIVATVDNDCQVVGTGVASSESEARSIIETELTK